MFNRALFLVVICLNILLTHHVKIGLGFQVGALKDAFENSIVSLKFDIISIFRQLHLSTQF